MREGVESAECVVMEGVAVLRVERRTFIVTRHLGVVAGKTTCMLEVVAAVTQRMMIAVRLARGFEGEWVTAVSRMTERRLGCWMKPI